MERRRSRSPHAPRGPRGSDRPRSPRGSRHNDRHDRRRAHSRSRSPPRGPRGDRTRDSIRERSPPRGPRALRRDSDEGSHGRPDVARREETRYPPSGSSAKSGRAQPKTKETQEPRVDIMEVDPEADDDEAVRAHMRKIMGFGLFRSTKNTKVPGNDKLYAVRKEKKAEYRQYMNRQGGFNRPLSPMRD